MKGLWVALLPLTLSLVSGCQTKCKPGDTEECWVRALSDPEQQEKAVSEIKERDFKSAEGKLIELFKTSSDNPRLREQLAEVFQKWQTKAAAPIMIEAVDYNAGPDKDGKKAKATNLANQKIATALGAIGDAQAGTPLVRLMQASKNPNVQRSAMRSLATLRVKEAVDPLIEFVNNTAAERILRANAIWTLGELGDPKAVPCLVNALYMEKAYYAQHANLALVKIGAPAVQLLIDTMNGKNGDVKALLEANISVLQGALEANAAQVLGDIGAEQAIAPILKQVEIVSKWDSENKLLVMSRLIVALGDIGVTSAIKPILPYLDSEYWDVRMVAATALTRIGDRSILPELLKRVGKAGDHPKKRVPLIEAIGNLGTDEQIAPLEALKQTQKDVDLTAAINQSLLRLRAYAECKASIDCWIGKLKSPEEVVREKAVYELGRSKDPKAIDPLIGIIDDGSENVRWALIDAFIKLKAKKAIEPIEELVEKKEKGSPRYQNVNEKYKRLIARLGYNA